MAASGIHGFNNVGGDLGHVYVVAAQMSYGDVVPSPLSPPSSAGTTESTPWSKIVKGGTANNFDEALSRPRKSKSLNFPVAHAIAVVG